MRLTFIQLPVFAAKWLRLKLTDEDLQALEALVFREVLDRLTRMYRD